jgi:hypothetical protein
MHAEKRTQWRGGQRFLHANGALNQERGPPAYNNHTARLRSNNAVFTATPIEMQGSAEPEPADSYPKAQYDPGDEVFYREGSE